ncbi:hypothetical protein ACIRBY_37740 [Streptomyces sp. NPDC096136]|uniref:hypothetical protein n=1 Tax=Streptomyces sp. NPDC096136 TaxID=3366076 RepID=UPI0037F48211
MAPDSRSAPPPKKSRTLALSAAAVTAIALTAAGIGYLAGSSEPHDAKTRNGIAVAGNTTLPFPEVSRTAGLSRVKTDSPGDPVKIRPCPGPAPAGAHDCQGTEFLDDGAAVQMWCLQDTTAPQGYPATHRRWFYVIQSDRSPHPGRTGWIYSALIPTTEQIRVPDCTIERILAAGPLPTYPAEPTAEPTTAPPAPTGPPAAATPPPAAPATPKAPEPTPPPTTPTTEPPKAATHTIREQTGRFGAPAFLNAHGAKGPGERIPAHTWVDVECRVYAPEVESARNDGWWYRITTSPWNSSYYAAANAFMNGDAPGHTPPTNTDWSVPVC